MIEIRRDWLREDDNKRKYFSHYLGIIFDNGKYINVIDDLIMAITESKIKYDAIAFRGVSGAAVGFPLSYLLKKPIICLRKAGSSHCPYPYEGVVGVKSYIIVDDFVDTGKSIKDIVEMIEGQHRALRRKVPVCKAVVLYRPYSENDYEVRNIIPGAKTIFLAYNSY